jgi:hypothetical protein
VNELTEFLRARLDERELLASKASPGPWYANAEHDEILAADDITVAEGFALSGPQLRATVDHIVYNDPARVLAEVDAKRQIIELAEEASGLDMQVDGEFRVGPRDTKTEPYVGDAILMRLALPYASHPGYREEWRP